MGWKRQSSERVKSLWLSVCVFISAGSEERDFECQRESRKDVKRDHHSLLNFKSVSIVLYLKQQGEEALRSSL